MTAPSTSLLRAAAHVIASEAGREPEGIGANDGRVAATVRIFETLHRDLSPLVGEAGFLALFARCVRLTGLAMPPSGDAYPVHAAQIRDAWIASVRACLGSLEPDEVPAVGAALLGQFAVLLTTLIGASMTQRLLHDAWPNSFPIEADATEIV